MFQFLISTLILLFNVGFFFTQGDNKPGGEDISQSYPFEQGEKIKYKMNYSIFTVGKAEISIYPLTYMINEVPCYKIDIYGRTAGAAAVVTTVNDTWGAFVDKERLLPVKAWRNLEEGRYRRKEMVNYFQSDGVVDVHELYYETGRLKETKSYEFDEPFVLDLVSGFAFLRTLDFSDIVDGDTIQVYGFLEDKFYKFNIMYKGTEIIKTKLGKINAHKLVPVMPDNSIFAGENSISAWIAADESKLPLVVEADMFIGSASCEITSFEGIKKKPIFID